MSALEHKQPLEGRSPLDTFDQVISTTGPEPEPVLTDLLSEWQAGSEEAGEQIARHIIPRLRRLARSYCSKERKDLTLDPTEVVHEAWLTLMHQAQPEWQNRRHFFWYTARLMRQCLIEHARRRSRLKRGSAYKRVELDDQMGAEGPWEELIHLDQSLAKLERIDASRAKIVELKYFVGLSFDEIAQALGIGRATAFRRWRAARAWLRHEMSFRSG